LYAEGHFRQDVGLPERIGVDNGANFKSAAFQRACENEGVRVEFRPPGKARYGGHIERLMGTMMKDVHVLPLNMLRYISNDLSASLVCFGVTEAREALQRDAQLARRFDFLTMPRWSADDTFEELVRAILRNQPLREKERSDRKGIATYFLVGGRRDRAYFSHDEHFGDRRRRRRRRKNHG
jgi:transposase InsO family protein